MGLHRGSEAPKKVHDRSTEIFEEYHFQLLGSALVATSCFPLPCYSFLLLCCVSQHYACDSLCTDIPAALIIVLLHQWCHLYYVDTGNFCQGTRLNVSTVATPLDLVTRWHIRSVVDSQPSILLNQHGTLALQQCMQSGHQSKIQLPSVLVQYAQ